MCPCLAALYGSDSLRTVAAVSNELSAFGTDGRNSLDDKEIALAQRALTATLSRIGISLTFPWRDFSWDSRRTFTADGSSGSR